MLFRLCPFVDTEAVLGVILFLTLGLGFMFLGYAFKRAGFVLFSGLVWVAGAVLILPEIGVAFIVIALGLGFILLFEGARSIAEA